MNIQQSIEILNSGGIGIFPTDTAFGIGCRIDREDSVKRLFEVRRRPKDKAVPVLVSSIEMAQEYLEPIPDKVRKELMEKYWPGGLTIILQSRIQHIPSLVRGGSETIGVRIPNHPTTLELIKEVGVPILGPSANFAGEATPYSFESLNPELIKLVDFVLPGECSLKQASTVIDCTVEPWRIVRQGAVKIESRAM